ncbi:ribbon-helix-helix domain-containing protein [Mycolicibacterium obuense]|uniref:ribbon-helix-helix domain-containing protein n=1 Tax=Mycolicibacterium obuense TaxID=1807 RepID=UPI000B2C0C93|nr:ribbon-helix-helix domain-containing protein [Mycolicibacterium obuense]
MSTKGDAKDPRLSVTPKAAIAEELNEMADATDLSKNELFNVAVDVLYFVWNVIRRGGTIGVKMPGEKDFKPYEFYIPGMTKPFSSVS